MEQVKSLMTHGHDSLAVVELRNWVETESKAYLSILNKTNASALIGRIESNQQKISQ